MLSHLRCNQISPLVRCMSTTSSLNRLRSEWRVDRAPANTKLGDEEIVVKRKAFGGRSKMKAEQVCDGNYTLMSKSITEKMKILDIIHSDAGHHYRENKIMAKGTVITVDVSSLQEKIDFRDLLFNKEQSSITDENDIIENHIKELLSKGQVYAKITSRPGQVGFCDGHILEGNELLQTVNKIKTEYGLL